MTPAEAAFARIYHDYFPSQPKDNTAWNAFVQGWNAHIDYRVERGSLDAGGNSRVSGALLGALSLGILATLCAAVYTVGWNGVDHERVAGGVMISMLLGIFSIKLWRRAAQLDNQQHIKFQEKWS